MWYKLSNLETIQSSSLLSSFSSLKLIFPSLIIVLERLNGSISIFKDEGVMGSYLGYKKTEIFPSGSQIANATFFTSSTFSLRNSSNSISIDILAFFNPL